MTQPQQTPTLAGAERGRVRPLRVVKGGIWIYPQEADQPINVPCALKVVRERDMLRCEDYARQALKGRGDGEVTPRQLGYLTSVLVMHLALCSPDTKALLYPLSATIADDKGRVNPTALYAAPLFDLVEGQVDRLSEEYKILLATETPANITHEEWERIVNEGKVESLRTLTLRHGSSALIQVLHGLDGRYPE